MQITVMIIMLLFYIDNSKLWIAIEMEIRNPYYTRGRILQISRSDINLTKIKIAIYYTLDTNKPDT